MKKFKAIAKISGTNQVWDANTFWLVSKEEAKKKRIPKFRLIPCYRVTGEKRKPAGLIWRRAVSDTIPLNYGIPLMNAKEVRLFGDGTIEIEYDEKGPTALVLTPISMGNPVEEVAPSGTPIH